MAREEYNEKDLNPSPKRVEGVEDYQDETADLGDSYGTLHKPALKIEKVDGEHSQKAIVNKEPQRIDNVLGVASAKKMVLPNKGALVDGNGDPLIKGVGEEVSADEIDSGSATAGQVLTANGTGGAEWKDAPLIFAVSNITAIGDTILSQLKVGDVVQKITGNEKHCYIVTYKEHNHGICLSYFAAGYSETVSYDYVGGHWVYNSTDISTLDGKANVIDFGDADPTSNFTSSMIESLHRGDFILFRTDTCGFVTIEESELKELVTLYNKTIETYTYVKSNGQWVTSPTIKEYNLSQFVKLYKHVIENVEDTVNLVGESGTLTVITNVRFPVDTDTDIDNFLNNSIKASFTYDNGRVVIFDRAYGIDGTTIYDDMSFTLEYMTDDTVTPF